MANIDKKEIGYDEVLAAGTANALMVQYKRAYAAPIDITEVFTSFDSAADYAASGGTSYAGQVIAVAGENVKTKVYKITSGGTLVELVDADALAEVVESAGKIASVKVNNEALEIAEDKSVNIDLSPYASTTWVTEYVVSAVTGGKVSLDGYATEAWVGQQGFITANDESVTSKASKTDVNTLSGVVETLIGEDANQTVREIAKNEVSLLVGNAPEALNTLEEIANWINSDSAGTVELVDKVASIETSVKTLSGVSHTHENKEVLDDITPEKVAAWDAAEANASAYTDTAIANLDLENTYEKVGVAQGIVNALDLENTYEKVGVAQTYADGLVSAVTETVNTLVGDDTNKSVRDIAVEEVAKVISGAPEAFDTLKEIADWISSDSAGTVELVDKVAAIETAVETLSGDSHTHENKEVLDDITPEKVAAWDAANTDSHKHTNKEVLDGITSEKVAAWDAAEANASAYTDTAIANLDLENTYEAKGEAAKAFTSATTYVDGKVKVYDGGIATEVTEENKINVLVQASTESKENYLKVKEDNTLAVNQIGLKDAVTTKEILVEGGEWASAVKKVYTNGKVPVGTSWESFLEAMLCVEKFAASVSTSQSFTVSCGEPGAGINGANNNGSVEVGTKVTLKAVSAKPTTASQTLTVKTMDYGYKVGVDGAVTTATAYTKTLTPHKIGSSTDLKEVFTKFTDKDGVVLSSVSGTGSLDAIDMYVAEGENKVVVSQTGDTYSAATNVNADTIYIRTNIGNFYQTNKVSANTITPASTPKTTTAQGSTTYKVTGYRNTFYGTTSSTADCDVTLIRSLTPTNSAVKAGSANSITITTKPTDNVNRMIIASPREIDTVKNSTGTQDISVTLKNTHKTLSVPGANEYSAVDYHVYDNTWKDTFGDETWIIIFK